MNMKLRCYLICKCLVFGSIRRPKPRSLDISDAALAHHLTVLPKLRIKSTAKQRPIRVHVMTTKLLIYSEPIQVHVGSPLFSFIE